MIILKKTRDQSNKDDSNQKNFNTKHQKSPITSPVLDNQYPGTPKDTNTITNNVGNATNVNSQNPIAASSDPDTSVGKANLKNSPVYDAGNMKNELSESNKAIPLKEQDQAFLDNGSKQTPKGKLYVSNQNEGNC